jgi:hypothetical protein
MTSRLGMPCVVTKATRSGQSSPGRNPARTSSSSTWSAVREACSGDVSWTVTVSDPLAATPWYRVPSRQSNVVRKVSYRAIVRVSARATRSTSASSGTGTIHPMLKKPSSCHRVASHSPRWAHVAGAVTARQLPTWTWKLAAARPTGQPLTALPQRRLPRPRPGRR